MAAPSTPEEDATAGGPRSLEEAIAAVTEVLREVACGRFDARAPRSYRGDAMDTLAFLVNATAEELGELVGQLRAERDALERAQAKLVHAAKLAALGELAGGVAHELNQPLTAIRSIVELAQLSRAAPRSEDLELIRRAAMRMARIVESVRTFGRPSPMRMAPSPAWAPVEAALELLADALRRDGIELVTSIPPAMPKVMGDVDRLQQVLVNLLANARDALQDHRAASPPRIAVAIRHDAGSIVYAVEDNGPGVAEEHVPHLFEPFFSTKEVGRGTGLGLSVSYGIVRDHGGEIAYERAEAGGARFVVRLAAARESEP